MSKFFFQYDLCLKPRKFYCNLMTELSKYKFYRTRNCKYLSVDPETIGLTLRRFLNVSWILLKLLLTNTSFFPCYTERYFLQSGICQQWKKRSKIISLFGENNGRITFIWYFSHPIRLALKDALKEDIAPVDESQMHLLHLFRNSSKNIEY